MAGLTSLPNIGEKLAEQLREAGIETEEELRRTGSEEAWTRILARDPSACIMRLYALEGAIRGIRWHDLDPGVKAGLKAYYTRLKPAGGQRDRLPKRKP